MGLPSLLQQLYLLVLAERVSEFRLLLLYLGKDVVAQLPDDVVALLLGKRELYRLQIAFDQFHIVLLGNL